MKRTLCTLVVCVAILCAGNIRAQDVILPLPYEDQQRLIAQLGPGVVGQPLPSKPIGPASDYFPLKNRALTYQVTAGSRQGSVETLELAQVQRPSGQFGWRFQFAPSLSGFLHQSDVGGLLMPSLVDSSEGVIVMTTPANPFVPTGMKPGESRAYQQQVSVNYLDDPTDQRFSGAVDGTCTYLGTYQVTVPAGTFSGVIFRIKFAGKVGPAQTKDTQYNIFAPGVGLIAMITQERVSAFWLFHIDTTTGKVLLSQQ